MSYLSSSSAALLGPFLFVCCCRWLLFLLFPAATCTVVAGSYPCCLNLVLAPLISMLLLRSARSASSLLYLVLSCSSSPKSCCTGSALVALSPFYIPYSALSAFITAAVLGNFCHHRAASFLCHRCAPPSLLTCLLSESAHPYSSRSSSCTRHHPCGSSVAFLCPDWCFLTPSYWKPCHSPCIRETLEAHCMSTCPQLVFACDSVAHEERIHTLVAGVRKRLRSWLESVNGHGRECEPQTELSSNSTRDVVKRFHLTLSPIFVGDELLNGV